MSIFLNGKRFTDNKYLSEKDFEDEVIDSSKIFFGQNTIYINAKKKIESKSLGGAVPDGFLFDFSDHSDPQFYIVEVELSTHNFFNHIFPQITKFFAFYKNNKLQKSLVDKLFSIINTDNIIKSDFKKHLGSIEIYKFLSDIIESSQNILLISDGPIIELPEIIDTYTDTWGRIVRHLEIKRYSHNGDMVHSINPEFEIIQYSEGEEPADNSGELKQEYSEAFQLEGVNQNVKEIYSLIHDMAIQIDPHIVFNPQKYYISIKTSRNIAYLKFRIKKIRCITMLPENEIKTIIKNHSIVSLSQPVQNFYNGPCAAVDLTSKDNFEEIETLLKRLVKYHKNS